MSNSIRTPRRGVTANSRRIAEAVDNEEWQKFRVSLKGHSTQSKLNMLRNYWTIEDLGEKHIGELVEGPQVNLDCDVCIRVDNYIKALCRGGQLHAGESLQTALDSNWKLRIKK